jgi:hypothetical protein
MRQQPRLKLFRVKLEYSPGSEYEYENEHFLYETTLNKAQKAAEKDLRSWGYRWLSRYQHVGASLAEKDLRSWGYRWSEEDLCFTNKEMWGVAHIEANVRVEVEEVRWLSITNGPGLDLAQLLTQIIYTRTDRGTFEFIK